MGSKISKAKCPSKEKPLTTVKATVVIVPRIPQELVDEIKDHLSTDPDSSLSLRSCALVSKSWVPSCRRHLLHTIHFTPRRILSWLEAFPIPEDGPAHFVRHLRFSVETYDCVPEEFFDSTPWFTNVEKVSVLGRGSPPWLSIPSFWRLPESATSLIVDADTVNLTQVRVIMAQLPNLENLSLSGNAFPIDWRRLPEITTPLRGRFSGKLQLLEGYADKSVMNVLMKIPTGLHFTEVRVVSKSECPPSTVRLADACSETLVKLSYTASFCCKSHPFS